MSLHSLLERLDPRRSLRARFALVLGATGLALFFGAGLWVERQQRQQIEATQGLASQHKARLLARSLDQAVQQRVLQMRQVANHPLLASGLMEPGDLRQMLEQLRASQPEFVWLALLDPRGQVDVATNAFLQGQDLSQRDAFVWGRSGPWVGQRHDPGPLERLLPLDRDGQAPRLLDLAVPVVDFNGRPLGVLLAELDWGWVQGVLDSLQEQGQPEDVLVLDRHGRPVLAWPQAPSAVPELSRLRALASEGGAAVITWADGRDHLSAAARTPAAASSQGASLELLVVLRQDARSAFAGARHLREHMLQLGAAASLGIVMLAAWLAGAVVRPLRRLADVAARLRAGEAVQFPPQPPHPGDEVQQLAGTLHALDTELRRRMTEQQRTAALYQAVFDGSPDAMYVRRCGRIEMANPACLAMFGAPDLATLQALRVEEMFVVTDPQVIAERVHRLTVQRLPVPLIEQQVRRRDGQLLDVETMATPVTDGGEPAFHVVMRDISERRRAQQALQAHLAALNEARGALQELNAGLEQRVAGRTAQLEAANAELDSFAYAVSHDLRAPLRALSGFSQALLEDHAERLDGDARLFLNQIILASHRMGALIDGLLSLSRSTRGQMQNGPVDLGELAERAMLELRSAEPARQLNLSLSGNLRVQGDARMLDAVMRNLIGNAWKYTARCALAQVRVSEEWRNGQRWIAVADNGAGFDMAHASRLFQAFTRLHRQDEFPGLGIGLATVQRIIKRHGGVIEMQAEVNRGATIRFHLPDTPATGPES